MFQLIRVPIDLLPAYRERQVDRLLRNLRVTLLAGGLVAIAFIPWSLMHDQSGDLPMVQLGVLMAIGIFSVLALTFSPPLRPFLDVLALATYVHVLVVASIILSLLPGGFLYGVGAFLSFTVVATVIAVDLRVSTILVMAISYMLIPNAAMAISDEPWLTVMNANWILFSGGMFAFGLAFLMDQGHRNAFLLEHALAVEKQRGDTLLASMLPPSIVQKLQETEDVIADIRPDATVLFADLVGFTELSRNTTPEDLIDLLTRIFTVLDELAIDHRVEKIKTIGDSYMVAAGVVDSEGRSNERVAEFGLEAIEVIRLFRDVHGNQFEFRVGMATGEVIGGVIGRRKPYFDLWGTTVNLASRLQSTAPPGAIHVDNWTAAQLSDKYTFEERGSVTLAGLGDVSTCLLTGRAQVENAVDAQDPAQPGRLGQEPLTQPVSTGTLGSLPHSDIEPS